MFNISQLAVVLSPGTIFLIFVASVTVVAVGATIITVSAIKKHKKSSKASVKKIKQTKIKDENKTKQEEKTNNKSKVNQKAKKQVTSKQQTKQKPSDVKKEENKKAQKLIGEKEVKKEDLDKDSKFDYVYDIKLLTEYDNENNKLQLSWKTNDKASAIASLKNDANSYINVYVNPDISHIEFKAKYKGENDEVKLLDKTYDLKRDKELDGQETLTDEFLSDVNQIIDRMKANTLKTKAEDEEVLAI